MALGPARCCAAHPPPVEYRVGERFCKERKSDTKYLGKAEHIQCKLEEQVIGSLLSRGTCDSGLATGSVPLAPGQAAIRFSLLMPKTYKRIRVDCDVSAG